MLNDKPADLISMFYIHNGAMPEYFSGFSKANGFALEICNDFQHAGSVLKLKHPDLIVIEFDDDQIHDRIIEEIISFRFDLKPAVFLSLAEYPGPEFRLKLIRKGYDDFLIRPFSIEEVKEKCRVFLERKNITQMNRFLKKKNEKTTAYLNRITQELKQAKTELYEERLSLNNALKQVNQMTKERSRLKLEIKDLKKNLAGNMAGFFQVISSLIKARVEKNRGHGERVAHIAGFISEQLRFDEKKKAELQRAAMLHEAGLLLIPERILQKETDQLSEYEKDLFVQYPVKGAELLSCCSEFDGCAEIIRHINENADGSGSPLGLKKRYIPLSSRILAGADVFDILKDQKELAALDCLLKTLEVFSGTRLDPNIVDWLEKYAVLHMGSDAYRVKGVGLHQLEPGMTLGTALFTHTGTKLFSVNTLLTEDAIDKIKKYNREYPVDDTVYIRA